MDTESLNVSKYRAIMTTTDRKRITGTADVSDEKRYQAVHRVRSRIDELEQDTQLLKEYHPDLYRELRDAICEE